MALRMLQKGMDTAGAGGQFWVFALAANGEMVYKYWDGTAWQPSQTGWNSLGGNFVGPPSCSVRQFTSPGSGAQIDVVAVGQVQGKRVLNTEALFHRFWDGSTWNPANGWDQLARLDSGNLGIKFAAHPVAIAGFDTAPNPADVVVVGSDGQAYHTYLAGPSSANPGWQPWENLGGSIVSAPAVAGIDPGFNLLGQVLSVFATDANGHTLYKYTDGSGWQPSQTGWNHLDDSVGLYNTAAAGANDIRVDVLGTAFGSPGQDQRLVHKVYKQSGSAFGWNPSQSWETVTNDNFVEGPPVLVATGTPLNRLDVFLGAFHNYLPQYQGSWLPQWEFLGPPKTDLACMLAAAAVSTAPDQTTLHVVGLSGEASGMWHILTDGSGWQPPGTEVIGSPSGGFLIPGYTVVP
jgi:hypothetical protein